MYSYKDIIKELLDDIAQGKYDVNEKMPSEQAISIKYGVSRIVSSRVFSELRKIGAIYSISKKGNFIARFFEGLIKPISYSYNANIIEEFPMEDYRTSFFEEYNVLGDFNTFSRKHRRASKLIIESDNWVHKTVKHNPKLSVFDNISPQITITSAISVLFFEKWRKTDKNDSLITYKILYFDDGIAAIIRYKVDPTEFKMVKQEFAL